jgi:hypothetical protein
VTSRERYLAAEAKAKLEVKAMDAKLAKLATDAGLRQSLAVALLLCRDALRSDHGDVRAMLKVVLRIVNHA